MFRTARGNLLASMRNGHLLQSPDGPDAAQLSMSERRLLDRFFDNAALNRARQLPGFARE